MARGSPSPPTWATTGTSCRAPPCTACRVAAARSRSWRSCRATPECRHLAGRPAGRLPRHRCRRPARVRPDAAWLVPAAGGTPRCLTPSSTARSATRRGPTWSMAEDHPGPAWLDPETLVVIVGDRRPERAVPGHPGRRACAAARAGTRGGRAVATRRRAGGAERRRGPPRRRAVRAGRRTAADPRGCAGSRRTARGWQDRFPLPAWEEAWSTGRAARSRPGSRRRRRAGSRPTAHHRDHPRRAHRGWRRAGRWTAPCWPRTATAVLAEHPRLGHASAAAWVKAPARPLGRRRRSGRPRARSTASSRAGSPTRSGSA